MTLATIHSVAGPVVKARREGSFSVGDSPVCQSLFIKECGNNLDIGFIVIDYENGEIILGSFHRDTSGKCCLMEVLYPLHDDHAMSAGKRII